MRRRRLIGGTVAVAGPAAAVRRIVQHRRPGQIDPRLGLRGIYVTAFAGYVAAIQRRQHGIGHIIRAEPVEVGIADPGGRKGFRQSRHLAETADGLRRRSEAARPAIGTRLAEGALLYIDDGGVQLFQPLITKPHPLHRAGRKAFHDHIRIADHLFQDLPPFRMFQVQRQTQLPGINLHEIATTVRVVRDG